MKSDLLHYIDETDSTNNRLKQMLDDGQQLPDLYTLYTFYQTAGRGQQGNSWESEQGKNLLFSTLLRPADLNAADQFRLSMLAPLAIVNVLGSLLSCPPAIKWPNDIYVGDKKLSGILIENTLAGSRLSASVIGVGLNVNQKRFLSPAPNPVSLTQLTGEQYDLHMLMRQITEAFCQLLPLLQRPQELKHLYMQHLYRREGWYPYVEREVSALPTSILQNADSRQFLAQIVDIDDSGCLCLMLQDQSIRRYHFKQVRYVITQDTAQSVL